MTQVYPRTWRRRLLPALAGAVVLGGCASAGMPAASPPSSPAAGRAEVAQLEQQIAGARAALGLPARTESFREPAQTAGDEVSAPAPAPSSASPPAAPPAEPASERRVARATGEVAAAKKQDACEVDPCRYARAICQAASRICDLARYLGDQDALDRCGRARQDCAEARRATRGGCPGC
jgi:hypothetical protein